MPYFRDEIHLGTEHGLMLVIPTAQDILKSFYGVEGHGTNLTYKVGHERIPENWYRMPNEYNLVAFNLDLLDLIAEYPELARLVDPVNPLAGVKPLG